MFKMDNKVFLIFESLLTFILVPQHNFFEMGNWIQLLKAN